MNTKECHVSANTCIRIACDAMAARDHAMAEYQLTFALVYARGTEHRLLRAHIVQALELTQKARHVGG